MKKWFSFLVCVMIALGCCMAGAESVQKEDYTVVPVNGAFNIRGVTPDGYTMSDFVSGDTSITIGFTPEEPARPSFVISIAFSEEYAGVERLNDLSEEEMKAALVADDPTVSDDIRIMETEYGTKVMILRSNDPQYDFACFVTLYKGYEVALNMFPGEGNDGKLTEEQIAQAMKFLSDLDFVPIDQ